MQGEEVFLLTALRDMRREVAELGERVDFTERLLAKQRERQPPRELMG